MKQKAYLDIMNCFSADHVGNRWKKASDFVEENMIHNEVIFFKETRSVLMQHIKNIAYII